jgi:ATP-dependent DNA helicase RecQ
VCRADARRPGRRRLALTVRDHEAEYVFLAPERLAKEDVLSELAGAGVSLIVVDEAHWVSAWGHDFRPSYLRLADAIKRLGRPPVAALTATASPVVRRGGHVGIREGHR